jgi:hypothetical protein
MRYCIVTNPVPPPRVTHFDGNERRVLGRVAPINPAGLLRWVHGPTYPDVTAPRQTARLVFVFRCRADQGNEPAGLVFTFPAALSTDSLHCARVLHTRTHSHPPVGHRASARRRSPSARRGSPDVCRPRRAPPRPPGQRATFWLKKWPLTIAPFDRPLKDNRGLSSPKGQFSSGCQTRVRGTHCPPFRHGQTRQAVPPARDLRPSVSLRAWFRRSRPSAFTSVSHRQLSGQIVTSQLANLCWSTSCSDFGQHAPQARPTARIGIERRSFQNARSAVPACAHWPRFCGNFASDASRWHLAPNKRLFETNVCFKQVFASADEWANPAPYYFVVRHPI